MGLGFLGPIPGLLNLKLRNLYFKTKPQVIPMLKNPAGWVVDLLESRSKHGVVVVMIFVRVVRALESPWKFYQNEHVSCFFLLCHGELGDGDA